jgi:hypothetical protein
MLTRTALDWFDPGRFFFGAADRDDLHFRPGTGENIGIAAIQLAAIGARPRRIELVLSRSFR